MPANSRGDLADQLHAADADVLSPGLAPWNSHSLRGYSAFFNIAAVKVRQLRREHHEPFLAALAIRNPQYHALAVDIAHAQSDDFEARSPAA